MGEVLAERRQWLAGASALLDRSPQRFDQRGEILRLQPCARGTWHVAAAVAACGLCALVGRKLLSPGQRRTGFGPLRGSRLALPAPALLRDPTDPPVLRPHASEVRRRHQARRPAGTPDDRTSATSHERLVGDRPGTTDKSSTLATRISQAAVLPASQCPGAAIPRENAQGPTAILGH